MLADWEWRFSHLYYIKPADQRPSCLFVPRPEQQEILRELYEEGKLREAILKARQLGFSTLLSLVCLDFLLFRPGVRCCVVDQTADDAERKRSKIKFAWDMLPPDLRNSFNVLHDGEGKFAIQLRTEGDRTRWLFAGKNPRGDTNDLLWISEWGPIQHEDAIRSDKIADGGLPSAEKGIVVVETTWRGGKSGRLWTEVVEQALTTPDEEKTDRDWNIKFFPWYRDHALVWEGTVTQITDDCRQYLNEVEKLAISEAQSVGYPFTGFTDAQRLWYYKVAWVKRHKRYEEYPTIMSEMFLSPEPGAIYTEEMATLRSQRRLTSLPIEIAHKVIVSFDLGRDDAMPMVFWQWIGQELRVVDYHTSNREVVDYYAAYIQQWAITNKVRNVQIVLPHDSRAKRLEARTSISEQFEELGRGLNIGWEVTVVGATSSIWDGIDDVRGIMPYMWMDADRCDAVIRKGDTSFPSLVECLDRYHAVEMRDGRNTTREPVHDRYCHGCDAVRTFAEAHGKGLIHRASTQKRTPKIIEGHGTINEGNLRNKRVRVKGRMS